MFLHLAPEFEVVEIIVVVVVVIVVVGEGGARVGGGREHFFRAVGGDDEERGDKGFLEVGEAETLRDAGDGGAEFLGEFDRGFVLEFLPPVLAI